MFVDLSHPVVSSGEMTVFAGTPQPRLVRVADVSRDGYAETEIDMFSHVGTHMDAPAHVLEGARTLDAFPVDAFVGTALSVDCRGMDASDRVTMERLACYGGMIDEVDFLLFDFGWDAHWGTPMYCAGHPCISAEVAEYAVRSRKKGIGLDTLSVDPVDAGGLDLHKRLLRGGDMVIIENMTNLEKVGRVPFSLFALPLKYENADGAPVRAIASVS